MQPNTFNIQPYLSFIIKVTIVLSAVILLVLFTRALPISVKNINTGVNDIFTVTGEGRVNIKPDVAVISLGVNSNAKTVKQAQESMNKVINQVTQELKKLGIKDEDIKTVNYNIYPEYDYSGKPVPLGAKEAISVRPIGPGPVENTDTSEPEKIVDINQNQKITGYSANTNLSIKVRDSEKVNQVIDIATAAGANQVGGITFDVDDREKAESEARIKAVSDAKKKAQESAKVAGLKLGKVVNYYENFNTPLYDDRVNYAAEGRGGGGGTEIQPGSMEVVISATLTYEVK